MASDNAAVRVITLRRADRCGSCGAELAAGARAGWDAASRTVTCLGCVAAGEPTIDRGRAGASAERTYQRRAERHHRAEQARVDVDRQWRQSVKQEHPLLGRLATAVTPKAQARPEPASVRSWAVGSPGERRVGEVLDGIGGVVALHDRRIPGRRANIDHVAVCPAGVWVIDAKRYVGQKLEYRDAGGWFRTDERLMVGGRDRTKLVDAMSAQVEAVSKVVAAAGLAVKVRSMLCFVDGEWGWFAKAFMVRGTAIGWPLSLPELLSRGGPHDEGCVEAMSRLLADALPPA